MIRVSVDAPPRLSYERRGRGEPLLLIPITIEWGNRDIPLLAGQARLQEELPPQSPWIQLPGCGHVPTYDDPALVASVILEGRDSAVGARR